MVTDFTFAYLIYWEKSALFEFYAVDNRRNQRHDSHPPSCQRNQIPIRCHCAIMHSACRLARSTFNQFICNVLHCTYCAICRASKTYQISKSSRKCNTCLQRVKIALKKQKWGKKRMDGIPVLLLENDTSHGTGNVDGLLSSLLWVLLLL